MLKLRTDIAYVGQMGKFTQAGVEAIQGQIDAAIAGAGASSAANAAAITAIQTSTSFVKLQTAVAAASQTSIDFTSVPSWVQRITVMFDGFSTNGTSPPLIQLGDAGGIETTGYLGSSPSVSSGGAAAVNTPASGFQIGAGSKAATFVRQGLLFLQKMTGNTWVCAGWVGQSDAAQVQFVAGSKTLSATLDRVRITTVGGTDTIDAGSVNISWE